MSSSNGLEKYPKLRFPGFDEPWEETPLSACFVKNIKKNTDGSVVNVICNSAKQGLIPQRDYFDKDIANSNNTNGYYIIEQNDFVYNPRKSSDAPYGPISRYDYAETGIVSPLYLCFRAKENIDTNFFEWYFRSTSWHRYIYMTGDSGARHDRVSIKDDDFFSMPICFPSAVEQEKIASFLNTIEERITSQKLLVDNLKKYKRGATKAIFSQELRLDKNASKWTKCKFGNVISLQSGQDFPPSDYNDAKIGIPYMIGASCIVNGRTIASRWTDMPRCFAYKGDTLLVCKGSGSGTIAMLAQDKVHIARQFMALQAGKSLTKEFCFYLALYLSDRMKRSVTGLIEGIDRNTVLNQDIFLPTISEQKLIVAFLSKLENNLTIQDDILNALLRLRTALMQQLFI